MARTLVTDPTDFKAVCDYLVRGKHSTVAIDTEYYGPVQEWTAKKVVDHETGLPACMSISTDTENFHVAINHLDYKMDPKEFFLTFRDMARKLKKRVLMHNGHSDICVLENLAESVGERKYVWFNSYADTMTIAALARIGIAKEAQGKTVFLYGLKDLAWEYLRFDMQEYDDVIAGRTKTIGGLSNDERLREEMAALQALSANYINKPKLALEGNRPKELELTLKKTLVESETVHTALASCPLTIIKAFRKVCNEIAEKQIRVPLQMHELNAAEVSNYAMDDTRATYDIHDFCLPLFVNQPYSKFYDKWMVPFLRVLHEMQRNGMRVNKSAIDAAAIELSPKVALLEKRWFGVIGVKITRHEACAKILFADDGYWDPKWANKTTKGLSVNKNSFSKAFLGTEEGTVAHDLAIMKIRHSKLGKILNTYTDSLVAQMPYRADGRVRTSLNPNGADTYRISSSSPNLNNIMNDDDTDDDVPSVRGAFIADPGNKLIIGDWSGIEVVVMAHFSKDKALCDALLSGIDMHAANAEEFGVIRKRAKGGFFAWFYGAMAKKIATSLIIPLAEAQRIVDGLNKKYVGVVKFRETAAAFARKHGYVETIQGRRRDLPFINDPNFARRARSERQAVNTVIQGSAADVAAVAGVKMHRRFAKENIPAKMLLQVYDEYIVETPEEYAEKVKEIMKYEMENCMKLSLPLKASVNIGDSWSEAK